LAYDFPLLWVGEGTEEVVGIGGVCRTVVFSSGLAGFCPAVSCASDVDGWELLLSSGVVGVGRKSVLCSSGWDVEGYKVEMYHIKWLHSKAHAFIVYRYICW